MELYKTEYSATRGKGKLDKILLNCENTSYYKLTNFLYQSQNNQAIVLNALYECDINVVLKFGYIDKKSNLILKGISGTTSGDGNPKIIKYKNIIIQCPTEQFISCSIKNKDWNRYWIEK